MFLLDPWKHGNPIQHRLDTPEVTLLATNLGSKSHIGSFAVRPSHRIATLPNSSQKLSTSKIRREWIPLNMPKSTNQKPRNLLHERQAAGRQAGRQAGSANTAYIARQPSLKIYFTNAAQFGMVFKTVTKKVKVQLSCDHIPFISSLSKPCSLVNYL